MSNRTPPVLPESIEGSHVQETEPVEVLSCHVCGNPLTGETSECNNCFRLFHLRSREDGAGPDCGRVWINEQFLSLEFACNACLGQGSAEPPVGRGH